MASVLVLAPDRNCKASKEAISSCCSSAIVKALRASPNVSACKQVTVDRLTESLISADVLVIGGGVSVAMRDMLKPCVADLKEWQSRGAGLIGICAGSVLLSSDARRGLGLCKGVALCEDNLAAVAGMCGSVNVRFRRGLHGPLGSKDSDDEGESSYHLPLHYENGPLMRSTSSHAVPFAEYAASEEACAADVVSLAKKPAEGTHKSRRNTAKGWTCGECGTEHASSRKKCPCGAKRQQEKRYARLREKLAGAMLGKVAVMGVTDGASRSILFGPHPELSSKQGGWDLLAEAVGWVCPHVQCLVGAIQAGSASDSSSESDSDSLDSSSS
mmetsp:Transcript_154/g.419  ORF Transcript_154/g.419 Transcript_154/m.419 type:complete len:329 (+) Transcript_154:98-1084(+)